MFSARTRWDRTPNRLSGLLEARRRAGRPVLDLTESNPTRAGLTPGADVLAPLADAANLAYEPSPAGSRAAREAVAADFARRSQRVEPDQLILTASTSEAYSLLLKLLCDPGDVVLVPRPSYPLFDYLAQLEGVELARYPLSYDGSWHLSPARLAEALPARARAVIVVNPNNPTGSFLARDEAAAVLELCARRELALISDDVFADYSLRPDPARARWLAGDGPALAFSLGGLSKACGLPQLKLAWIAIFGPEAAREEARARLEIIADTYLSVSTPVQHAARSLLARIEELQRPIRERVTANHAALLRLTAGSVATPLDLAGGWYGVVRVPASLSEEDRVCRVLERHGVLVHPGYFFDFESEAFLVVSLLTPREVFEAGVARVIGDLDAAP